MSAYVISYLRGRYIQYKEVGMISSHAFFFFFFFQFLSYPLTPLNPLEYQIFQILKLLKNCLRKFIWEINLLLLQSEFTRWTKSEYNDYLENHLAMYVTGMVLSLMDALIGIPA